MTAAVPLERWSRICIVGLGLIGGSMALALRRRLPQLSLIGVDRESVIAAASGLGLADEYIADAEVAAVTQAFARSDLVVLATPVSGILRWLGEALTHGALVTDCGSTKREIVLASGKVAGAGARFVPGHPMAGAGAGRPLPLADLFEGRPWVLCPDGADPAALAEVERLVACVGACPVRMPAAVHDRAVALTSHAPRIVASALTAIAQREQAFEAAGPAFERFLRGSGGSPEMWRDVFGSNADEVARALRLLLTELEACAAELELGKGLDRNLETLAAADRARVEYDSADRPKRLD